MDENADRTETSQTGSTSQTGTAPPPPPTYQPLPPRPALRRSVADRKVAGVAGGLGRYFGIDPLIFRVVFVTLALFGGSGLLLYAVGWLLVPEDGEPESEAARLVNGRATTKVVAGIILAVVGIAVVGNFARTDLGFGGFAALLAIGFAAFLIFRDGHPPAVPPRSTAPAPPPGAFGQTTGTAYAAPASTYAAPAETYAPASTYAAPAATYPGTAGPYAAAGSTYPGPAMPYADGGAPSSPVPPTPPGWYPLPPPPPPRERSPLGRITASLTVLAAGALVAWNLGTDSDVATEAVLAICLAIVGTGLVVGAFVGRARGLIFLGALLAIATTAASFNPIGFHGGVGDRVWHPRTVAAVQDGSPYRLGAGDARLDLTDLDLSSGQPVRVSVRVGVGSVRVTLPAGVPVHVTSHQRAGNTRILDADQQDGTDVREDVTDPADATDPLINLDVQMGVGELEVFRATP